jgi:acetolactate synthase I/III small subunit
MELDYSYECTLSILVENQPSILTRIVGLLSRRGFIIESLAVGSTEYEGLSRVIIVLPGNLRLIDQLTRQLYKIFTTVKVFNLTNSPSITRELILLKLLASIDERRQILEIAKVFELDIIDYTNKTITLEITGNAKKIVAAEQMLYKFGILEKVRTGTVGLTRESLTTGQLYTVDRDTIRRKMIDSHVSELETKFYL